MARTLNDTLLTVFSGNGHYNYTSQRHEGIISNKIVYMEVPINKELFEIPILALNAFENDAEKLRECSRLVVGLQDCGNTSYYSTLDRIMRDLMTSKFQYSKLHQIKVKQGNDTITYYASRGAVFDEEYNPIMMMSWELEKKENTQTGFDIKRMILRVYPDCYISKTDPMRRMIATKIINLMLDWHSTKYVSCQGLISGEYRKMEPIIEIAKCPFHLKYADGPSSLTTNKHIISAAQQHIEEVLQ